MLWVSGSTETAVALSFDAGQGASSNLGGILGRVLEDDVVLVIDDADPQSVLPLIPHRFVGNVLVTSQTSQWPPSWRVIELSRVDRASSIRLLANLSGEPETSRGIYELASHIDGLPLALVQAGSYLAATGSSSSAYLEALRTDATRSFGRSPEQIPRALTEVVDASMRRLVSCPVEN